ncbi:hypothetical protein [Pseudomonas syringae]|uniref:hypothetical protein n=1 Tax=Pseudomonas syringae TaxID=317 RepID=UPI00073F554D|nr:hypothetical protein [Pseudomonas syringae]POD79255.1 hypothetical protein BKM17_06385 [Pseudomonas syringae group genomosp. 3]
MISRFKWYAVRLPLSKAEAFQKLEHYRYGDGERSGFIVDAVASSFEFYWPTPIFATSIDEYGQAQRSEIFSVSQQRVDILGTEKLVLRIQDPPRSSRELLNTLERLFGFGFVCEQVPVTDALIKKAITEFHSVTLSSVRFSGGLPDIAALARIELTSKQGLKLGIVDGFNLQGVSIESANYSIQYKGLSGHIGFTKSGICKISGELSPLIQSKIEDCIQQSIR